MSRTIVNRFGVRPRSALIALFAFCAAAVADGSTDRHSSKQYTRIVVGDIARTGAWPWQVALVKLRTRRTHQGTGFRHSCSGTVIAPRWVLTAAHCVDGLNPGDLKVLAGTHDLGQGGRRIDVTAIRVHEDYTDVMGGSDIALLRLARAVGVASVDVPTAEQSEALATPGTLATMIGWGGLRPLPCGQASGLGDNECENQKRGLSGLLVSALTSYLVDIVTGHLVDALTNRPVPWSDVQSSKLMEVELPLIGEQTCREAYPDATIDHRTLCAGMRRDRKRYSCQGDSGGPLLVRDDDTWVQAGVVSWGVSCAKPGRYGVYTRVGTFADWIRAETGLALAVAGSGATPQEMAWSAPAASIPIASSPGMPSSQEHSTTGGLPTGTWPGTSSSDGFSGSAYQSEVAAAAGEALGHGNAAGVRLQIRPSSRLRVGDAVTYRVESGRSGHLLIVNVAADGTVTQLFPNRFSERAGRGTTIGAGRIVEIPNAYDGFRLRVSPPLGRGSLFAVVAEDPVALDDLLDLNRDLRPVENAKDWLIALGERLREPLLEASGTRRARWSTVRVEYEIAQ